MTLISTYIGLVVWTFWRPWSGSFIVTFSPSNVLVHRTFVLCKYRSRVSSWMLLCHGNVRPGRTAQCMARRKGTQVGSISLPNTPYQFPQHKNSHMVATSGLSKNWGHLSFFFFFFQKIWTIGKKKERRKEETKDVRTCVLFKYDIPSQKMDCTENEARNYAREITFRSFHLTPNLS